MYKSLDTIPFKLFYKILDDNSLFYLLSNEDKEFEDFTPEELIKCASVWDKIYNSFLEIAPNDEDRKILNINREIEYLTSKHKLVITCCDCLSFDWNDEIVAIIRGFGYKLTDDNYYKDIETITRECDSLLIKCDRYIKMLPEQNEEEVSKEKINIDEMFASFSAILGIDFDYNTISFTKTKALQKQVEFKLKSLESINSNK